MRVIAVLCTLACAGCSGAVAEGLDLGAAPSAAATVSEPLVASSATAPSSAPSAEPPPLARSACAATSTRNPNGPVPADLLSEQREPDALRSPPLDRAGACAAALQKDGTHENVEAQGCSWDGAPVLLGFNAVRGHAAVITLRERQTAGEECPEAFGEILDLGSAKSLSSERLFKVGPCDGFELALSRYAATIERQGFSAAKNLVVKEAVQPIAATGYAPLVVLDAPLCGWMVYVTEKPAAKKLSVALVSPANDASYDLGAFPIEPLCMGRGPGGACSMPYRFAYPTVREVALTPDGARLYVSIAATPGGHNLPLRFHRAAFPLPKAALAAR